MSFKFAVILSAQFCGLKSIHDHMPTVCDCPRLFSFCSDIAPLVSNTHSLSQPQQLLFILCTSTMGCHTYFFIFVASLFYIAQYPQGSLGLHHGPESLCILMWKILHCL